MSEKLSGKIIIFFKIIVVSCVMEIIDNQLIIS